MREIVSEKVACHVVQLIGRHNVAAIGHQRQQDAGNGGHPGTHRRRCFRALEIGDFQFQTTNRRIAPRRVSKVWSLPLRMASTWPLVSNAKVTF